MVVAVDPGREKCGIAVVGKDGVLHKEVVAARETVTVIANLVRKHKPDCVVVGAGTTGKRFADALRENMPEMRIELVDERNSTLRARARFFKDNPPRGLMRLIPKGLLIPNRPYDDYVALILAEDYLSEAQ